MAGTRKRKKRAKRVGVLGRLMALLPVSCALLYPLYLAAQLDTVEEMYESALLPKALDALRVAFVSDIHYGTFLKEDRVRDLAARVNALDADVVILGGDYGEDSAGAISFFRLHPGFQARWAVLGVMGNHDRTLPESNLPVLSQAMREDGVMPLVNDVMVLERGGKRLAFAGTDDYFNGYPDLDRVAKLCRGADFTVYISHVPDILPKTYALPGGPFYQLALCGHTHGGQVAIRGHAIKSSSDYGDRYLSGWYRENGVDILVSNGVGTSGLPVRLGARPQIHLLTLKSKTNETP